MSVKPEIRLLLSKTFLPGFNVTLLYLLINHFIIVMTMLLLILESSLLYVRDLNIGFCANRHQIMS